MKIKYLFLLLTMLCLKAAAQSLSETELIGTWKITGVENIAKKLTKEQTTKIGPIIKSFLKAKIILKADYNFSLDVNNKEMKITNNHWKLNKKTGSVIVQQWKDKNTDKSIIMEILTKTTNGQIVFFIDGMPLILLVTKE